eukprot:1330703-Alexandrium_andersonii.AAC.1
MPGVHQGELPPEAFLHLRGELSEGDRPLLRVQQAVLGAHHGGRPLRWRIPVCGVLPAQHPPLPGGRRPDAD